MLRVPDGRSAFAGSETLGEIVAVRVVGMTCVSILCLLLSFASSPAAGQLPPGATIMPGGAGSGPEQQPPSEEDRATEGARIVASKEQNPCVDKADTAVRLLNFRASPAWLSVSRRSSMCQSDQL